MEFFYVFGLMFLAIFGAVMLAELFCRAIFRSSVRSFDIYLKSGDDLADFVEQAQKSDFIGQINIINGEQSEQAKALAEKYDNVHLCENLVNDIDRN